MNGMTSPAEPEAPTGLRREMIRRRRLNGSVVPAIQILLALGILPVALTYRAPLVVAGIVLVLLSITCATVFNRMGYATVAGGIVVSVFTLGLMLDLTVMTLNPQNLPQ